jgi:hypothetical protein
VPFLRWLREQEALDPKRDVIFGNAEAQLLYDGLYSRYEPAESAPADVDVPTDLAETLFAPYLNGHTEIKLAIKHGVYERLPTPDEPPIPRPYVVVAFDASPAFPDRTIAAALARDVVESLADGSRVVVIGEHSAAFGVDVDGDRVRSLASRNGARESVASLLPVIAGARAFIGLWSGIALLPPYFGVPALVVAPTEHAWLPRIELASRLARALESSLTVVDAEALPLVTQLASRANVADRVAT